jgi:endoglycosylceramidase
MRNFFVLFYCMALTLATLSAQASTELSVTGNRFADAQQRTVILRGVNVSANSKLPPFTAFEDFNIFPALARRGVNVIRLLFNWEAYEPALGAYNENYLAWLKNVAAAAWKNGIYVVVDFHQDAFSRYVARGCGEGFPAWATAKDAEPSEPDNGVKCTNWVEIAGADFLLNGSMKKSFRAFYGNKNEVRPRFITLWKKIAATFKTNPGVIGYDIINEPWGNEPSELNPLYEDVARAIRSEDPTAILFIEPQLTVGIGLAATQLGKPTFGNFAYAPHFYDPRVATTKKWDDSSLAWMNSSLKRMQEVSRKWNVPVFIGEYGISVVAERGAEYLDEFSNAINAYGFSSAQWAWAPRYNLDTFDGWNFENFSITDQNGNWQKTFRARPYVQKIGGNDARSVERWDQNGNLVSFKVEWNYSLVGKNTHIFLPSDLLSENKLSQKLTEDSALVCERDKNAEVLSCKSSTAGNKQLLFEKTL